MDREYASENLRSDDVRLTEAEAAYFAGFIDGEGTFTIVRSKRKGRRLGWQYSPSFSVANSDLELLLSLRTMCRNGRIKSNYHKKIREYHRTVYQLKFWAHQMRLLIPQLLPYLRGKRRQAEILLRYLQHTTRTGGEAKSDEYWQTVEAMRVEICNLNLRGGRDAVVFVTPTLRTSRQGINQWSKPPASA